MTPKAGAIALLAVVAVGWGAVRLLRPQPVEPTSESSAIESEGRQRIRAFWEAQRAATEHRVAGRTREAADAYDRALTIDPDHEDALYYAGATHLRLGNAVRARDLWRHLVEVNPSSARAHHQLGDLYLCLDYPDVVDLSAAEVEFRRALAINQEETGPLLQLAEVAMAGARWDEASTLLSTLLTSNPESQPAIFYRGFLAWRDGRPVEALDNYRAARALSERTAAAPSQLVEGETATGGAMLALPETCRQFEDPLEDLTPQTVDSTDMDDRYRLVAEMLEDYRD